MAEELWEAKQELGVKKSRGWILEKLVTILKSKPSSTIPLVFLDVQPSMDLIPLTDSLTQWNLIWLLFQNSIWYLIWHSIGFTCWHFIWLYMTSDLQFNSLSSLFAPGSILFDFSPWCSISSAYSCPSVYEWYARTSMILSDVKGFGFSPLCVATAPSLR